MPRAEITTWLPIDEWARIVGLDPLHFAGVTSADRPAGNCASTWLQHAWQGNSVGREDVARAIDEAERRVAEVLGYNLVPDWTSERVPVPGPWNPATVHATMWGANAFGIPLRLSRRRYISGGVRADAVLEAGAAVTWPGGADETFASNRLATVTITGVDAGLNACEVRAYFRTTDLPSEFDLVNPADDWEIRPFERASVSGTTLTLTIRRERLVDPDLWEALDPAGIDGDLNSSFVAAIDVYRVYHDPQTQAQLEWLPSIGDGGCGTSSCTACLIGTQSACTVARDATAGLVAAQPATWDADEESFTSVSLSVCRAADRVLTRYRSGHISARASCDRVMEPEIARAIAMYAASLLPGEICGCEVSDRIKRWRTDMGVAEGGDAFTFQPRAWQLSNPLGQTRGAVEAWRLLRGRAEASAGAVGVR